MVDSEGHFLPVSVPKEFDVLCMGNSFFTHVGVYTESDGGFVIHAVDGARVIAETVQHLRTRFKRLCFYRWYYNADNC